METHYIGWWNLENLFDVKDSQWRPEYLQRQLNHELQGWTQDVLDQKLQQLASVILQMNDGTGPDLLGVCEVENRSVLIQLVEKLAPLDRNYGVAHHDTSDNRGVDIAFIYDQDRYTVDQEFHHHVLKRSATRDIFQINVTTAAGNPLIFIGNHWPARSGGQYPSEPFRMIAAETLSYWMERIHEIRGDDIPIVVMGDFNDECFNRSITEYALGTNSRQKVLNSRSPRLLNLMWELNGTGVGTFYYSYFPYILDQFMVSKGTLLSDSPIKLHHTSNGKLANIELPDEMVSGGDYKEPIPFGRPSSGTYNPETGFSDHYPVSMRLMEE